jgi:hypothetical protein
MKAKRSLAGSCHRSQIDPFRTFIASFDDLVGAREQRRRHVEAKRFGGLEVDHSSYLGRGLHRHVGRLLALEDAVDVFGRA